MKPSQLDRLLWRTRRKAPDCQGTQIVATRNSHIRVRDSGGDGPAVAFLCDPPIMVEAYDELIELLSPAFRVLVIELPGFGFSTPDSGDAYAFDAAVEAIEEALVSLQTGPLVVAGPCICGFVATAIARRGNLDVRGQILMQAPDLDGMHAWCDRMDPKGQLRTPYLGQLLVRLNARRLTRFWISYATSMSFDHEQLVATTVSALGDGGAYPLATMLQEWSSQLEERAVDVPTLAIWGRHDRSHKHTDPQCSLAHAPSAEVMEFEDCGHFVELEEASRFVDAVTPFLRRCLLSGT